MMRLKTFILTVLLMLPISINAQTEKFDWNPVMDAIIQVESRGNAKAHNPIGDCAGILQITPCLVSECNKILKEKKSTKRYTKDDRYNVTKSKEMFVLMQEKYNPGHNVEKAIRCWNSGFCKDWKNRSTGYYKKVMKHYKKEAK
jgi:hypothetical protein